MKLNKRIKKGFTLVELVVVIAVIAILSAVSVGAYFGITSSAKDSKLNTEAKTMYTHIVLVSSSSSLDKIDLTDKGLYIEGSDIATFKEEINKNTSTPIDVTLNNVDTSLLTIDTIYLTNSSSNDENTYDTFNYYSCDISDRYASISLLTGTVTLKDVTSSGNNEDADLNNLSKVATFEFGEDDKIDDTLVEITDLPIYTENGYDLKFSKVENVYKDFYGKNRHSYIIVGNFEERKTGELELTIPTNVKYVILGLAWFKNLSDKSEAEINGSIISYPTFKNNTNYEGIHFHGVNTSTTKTITIKTTKDNRPLAIDKVEFYA